MVPISAFSTLYGSPMYVKSLYVCYSVAGLDTYISATQGVKRKVSNNSYELYLDESPAMRDSATVSCYTVNAATPYKSLDSSSFVQFTMHFGNVAFGSYIDIHEVKLTLTEISGE
jgi:hypothetical protein